ncbi:DNA recombination protein RmuC [Candidatus Pantoea edessiphila]|uniref:DNA recombination protein RmuC n=1 Tax=Candidatus Pantoea edessiphila TaxID=2044610 RepID=A0A2P5SXG4_9GAMM|nr:DNA recombination protein RmuC [Candidatus Pantoea edessiphila]MBK4775926.1 DNA recombination protein RmuC [Pantoea sp. Edef]PPI86990.1 DNA recombination protein RmuC [Candidatus Pantoea edessiphila]
MEQLIKFISQYFINLYLLLIGFMIGFLIAIFRCNNKIISILVKTNKLEKDIKQLQQNFKTLGIKINYLYKLINSKDKSSQKSNFSEIKEEAKHVEVNENCESLINNIWKKNKIFINEQIALNINQFILPLREQINNCIYQLRETIKIETQERNILTNEIKQLQKFNSNMAQETINLTNALRGNSKFRGHLGEIILSRILESAGLREGHEYETQISIKSDQNSKVRPDVIIRLPRGKNIIIDSKMILLAYEKYFNSKNQIDSEKAIKEHINAIRVHMRSLSQKNYQQLPNLRSLDYILMFIPIEPAFLLAVDHEPNLLSEALQQNIMLVSPTTLLVALRTINNLWNHEHQNQNVQHIADSAAKIYDKMRLFVDDMNSIGDNLDKTYNSYKEAMKKLAEGRGNIIKQAEKFRELGVNVKCSIDCNISKKSNHRKYNSQE